MLRIDKPNKTLIALERKTMRESGYWERRDIQEMICRAPTVFCEELEEQFHLVGSEVQPTDFVQDRIDLLAVDPDGGIVIIEIKRDSHKLHLLQALSYSAMVAKWEPKRFIEQLTDFNKSKGQNFEQAKEELEELLEDGEIESINRKQRILLLAEAFDYEVLATAEWLTETYGVDIRCYRVALAKYGNEEFLTCTRAFPPPEITDFAIRRRQQKEIGAPPTTNWDEALQLVDNKAVVQFFREELAAGRRNNPKYKRIQFLVGDRRRFIVYAKRRFAWVSQHGRFENDIEFWKTRLGERGDVAAMQHGRKLRFYLFDEDDFSKFNKAVTLELLNTEFHGAPEEETDEAEHAAE